MKKIFALFSISLFLLLVSSFCFNSSIPANTKEYEFQHNCRLYAAISEDFPEDLIYNHLISEPYSLKNLATINEIDGWGISQYSDSAQGVSIKRGAERAYNDTDYDNFVNDINSMSTNIVMAHIRYCSSGCCCHGCETIDDPHPFYRVKNQKTWTFIHNGEVSMERMYVLLGNYLNENPLTGSNIPECDPTDPDLVIDSELYFLYLLKNIEEKDWDIKKGISRAITILRATGELGILNFILSDGETIWAYRNGIELSYVYDEDNGYSAVASQPPSVIHDDWIEMNDNQLVILKKDGPPVLTENSMRYVSQIFTNNQNQPVQNIIINYGYEVEFIQIDTISNDMIVLEALDNFNIRKTFI